MKFRGTPREGLFGATVAFFIGFAAVSLFGPTAKKLQDVMGLTPTMVGFLVAMPSLSGSLLRIPFAAWVDTVGGRKPFLVLLSLSILGMSGLTFVMYMLYPDQLTPAHAPWIYFLGLLSGCGIATFSVGTGQVSYWFPKRDQGGAKVFSLAVQRIIGVRCDGGVKRLHLGTKPERHRLQARRAGDRGSRARLRVNAST